MRQKTCTVHGHCSEPLMLILLLKELLTEMQSALVNALRDSGVVWLLSFYTVRMLTPIR